jgi:glutathione synthase/RimK-type ligase-like ATP-grasp enzyme
MARKDIILWCSGATDQTGKALADALKISMTKEKPKNLAKVPLIIGWGAKTKKDVDLGKTKVFNHPNKIRINRNKLDALKVLAADKVNVAPFIEADQVIAALANAKSKINLPLVGRTKYHQGGKGLWMCPQHGQVEAALQAGAQYFQNMLDIKDEYRIHVVGGEVVKAVKKVLRDEEEMKDAFVRKELERQKALAEKNEGAFDEKFAERILKRQADRMTVDHLTRSNTRGWKFSNVTKYDKDLAAQSIKAVKALGLEFGAVDCCVDRNGTVWVIEINTGPGLEGSSLEAYVKKLDSMIEDVLNPKSAAAKLAEKVMGKKKEGNVIAEKAADGSLKEDMQKRAALMSEMIAKSNEDECKALKSVFAKMFKD